MGYCFDAPHNCMAFYSSQVEKEREIQGINDRIYCFSMLAEQGVSYP
jgi:hypothetical protein